MKHHVIYVPGILDDIAGVQSFLVSTWRLHGVSSQTHVMPWRGEPDYSRKAEQLLNVIDNVLESGHQVSLIGASAGASAVLNAFWERADQVSGLALICPKVNNSTNIGAKIINNNPSFLQAMNQLEMMLPKLTGEQKSKMVNFLSSRDGLISYQDSSIHGVKEIQLPALRHNLGIMYGLSFGAGPVLKELKRIAGTA